MERLNPARTLLFLYEKCYKWLNAFDQLYSLSNYYQSVGDITTDQPTFSDVARSAACQPASEVINRVARY